MIESMQASPVARVIISISAMLFAGFAMTRITKRFRLPNVTGYILAGILMGPCCLNVIPQTIIDGTDFLSDVALAFIAFSAGEFFKVDVLRRNGAKVIIMDEPTNGFDIPSKSQMRKVIASSMTDEKTIVISTHQVRDVENLLDHVLMIDSNRLMLDATFNAIAERLYFAELPLNEPADDALFVQPSLQGKSAIFRNRAGEESTINLELLFNAMLVEGDKIKDALK